MYLSAVAGLVWSAAGASFEFRGQASGWAMGAYDTALAAQAGLRYVPTISAAAGAFDLELAANGMMVADFRPNENPAIETRLKPYRAWVRVCSPHSEVRAGLQKLNFGSAALLRPLQWFDRLDPRDPLALTDGVYGLLGRYWFQNNANVWAWGLWGNTSPKGLEAFGSDRRQPELGARVQLPVPKGEAALSYHHRRVDLTGVPKVPELMHKQDEDRLGFDLRLDVGPGVWCEAMARRMTQKMVYGPEAPVWHTAAMLGADYTFGIGNGLHLLAEHILLDHSSARAQFSAAMASYPLGLFDNLRAMVFFDWTGKRPYTYLAWQHTLDRWVFDLSGFFGPDTPSAFGGAAGKGARLLVAFNH